MLLGFVVLYLLVSIAIGLYAARRVHSASDYVVASRALPIYVTIATVFATWFGSETVLGIPASFLEDGLGGIISDPFGASMCLILVGLLFARPLYRLRLLTIGDFYRRKYGRTIELLVALAICSSYLGWVAAQVMALGLVFEMLSHGVISQQYGMLLGTGIVLLYTLFGGMWSVALTDFMQMILIVVGLLIIAWCVSGLAGGVSVVVAHAAAHDKLHFLPEASPAGILAFLAAWVTMGFGSIPQQDVFQRVMSAKDENTAVRGTVIGGVLYLVFAFIPIFLGYSAWLVAPEVVTGLLGQDSQKILPYLIMNHTPLAVQILFFGALLSAIMSTASGTLLAPSSLFAENVLRGVLPRLDDRHLLRLIRGCVVGFAGLVLLLALNSDLSIFEMVENAYKVTLVGAFVPLAAGVYWPRANTAGATLSIIAGVGLWLLAEGGWLNLGPCPAQLGGFLAAVVGMIGGSLLGRPGTHVAPMPPSVA